MAVQAEETVTPQYFYKEEPIQEIEDNNSMDEAQSFYSGQKYTGTVSSDDDDFYQITFTQDQRIAITPDIDSPNIWAYVYDEFGNEVMKKELTYANVDMLRADVAAGTYYVKIETDSEFSGRESQYTFALTLDSGYWYRLAGSDRYETSADIAYRYVDIASQIIIATGQDFPDALAAGPLAKKLNAPILLTRKDELPTPIKDFINYGGRVRKAIIIGGENVVSLNVEHYLKNTLGIPVERIAGANRFETAALIAERLVNVYGDKTAYMVNGRNFPDALSISPVAAMEGAPILLTETDSIPEATANKLALYEDYYIIGGENAVSAEVEAQLPNTTRISGDNRYETSAYVADYFSGRLAYYNQSYIATGNTFADALAGSPVAATYNGPMLLTPSTYLHEATRAYIEAYEATGFVILGGKNAVSEKVVAELRGFYE